MIVAITISTVAAVAILASLSYCLLLSKKRRQGKKKESFMFTLSIRL